MIKFYLYVSNVVNLLHKRFTTDLFKPFFDQSVAEELVKIQSKY